MQVASCERTCLPTGEAAAKVKSILKEQNSSASAMRVMRLGSRTGSRPVSKSFGMCLLLLFFTISMTVVAVSVLFSIEHDTSNNDIIVSTHSLHA